MKLKLWIFFVVLNMGLLGCFNNSSNNEQNNVRLQVFAASSLSESLIKIGDEYMKNNPNVKISFNFDSSGILKSQIVEGASCDIFISASNKQMDQLLIAGKNSSNLINESTRNNLLENKVVLAVNNLNKFKINSFKDMVENFSNCNVPFAIGNSDVPVGQYTLKLFDYLKIKLDDLENRGCISYGSNVKEVTSQIINGVVKAGIVYQTDAYSSGLKIVDYADEKMVGKVVYPVAVMKNSSKVYESEKFLNYLKSDSSVEIFQKVGFTVLLQ